MISYAALSTVEFGLYCGAGSTLGADSSHGAGSTTGTDSGVESAPVPALYVCGAGSGIGSGKIGIITALVYRLLIRDCHTWCHVISSQVLLKMG